MILSGNEIKLQHEAGTIVIEPWDDARVNPNSYNVSLAPELMVYTEACLDPRQDNRTRTITIPEAGLVLTPGKLYLGRTNEWTETYGLVPKLEGRSSIGRLGLFIHVTAGYGDVGFKGYWTLEIVAVEPVRIYPNMEIGQLSYHPVCGEVTDTYHGKYQGSREIVSSRMYREMEGDEMTRKETLDAAEACVRGHREQDYGSPEDNFRTIAEMWRSYIQTRCVGTGVVVDLLPEDVAAMMVLLKVGRIAGGSASQDNWVDIAGYAACGGEISTKGAVE